jgi:hypothetical protein
MAVERAAVEWEEWNTKVRPLADRVAVKGKKKNN